MYLKKGFLIAYDENGNVWFLDGEAEGEILPHVLPVGQLKVKELEFGQLANANKIKYSDSNGLEILEEKYTDVEADEINLLLLQAEGVV